MVGRTTDFSRCSSFIYCIFDLASIWKQLLLRRPFGVTVLFAMSCDFVPTRSCNLGYTVWWLVDPFTCVVDFDFPTWFPINLLLLPQDLLPCVLDVTASLFRSWTTPHLHWWNSPAIATSELSPLLFLCWPYIQRAFNLRCDFGIQRQRRWLWHERWNFGATCQRDFPLDVFTFLPLLPTCSWWSPKAFQQASTALQVVDLRIYSESTSSKVCLGFADWRCSVWPVCTQRCIRPNHKHLLLLRGLEHSWLNLSVTNTTL